MPFRTAFDIATDTKCWYAGTEACSHSVGGTQLAGACGNFCRSIHVRMDGAGNFDYHLN